MNADEKIRVAVVGAGAFGRNHARIYAELQRAGEPVELLALVDQNRARAEAVLGELGLSGAIRAYSHVDDLLADPANLHITAASVAVPTGQHLQVSQTLMQGGVDVLIEKPIAATLNDAGEMIATAERTGRIAMAGHLERFNPAIRATLPLVTRPMFFEVHRLSVFTPRSLDVDVVLDLMIHDLDIVLWLVRSPIREIRAVGIPILSSKVDIANVRVEFGTGCVANFTASRVSTERVRKLRFFQPRQYVSLDYGRRDVFSLSVQPAEPPANDVAPPVPGFDIALPSGFRLVPSRPRIDDEEPLRSELRAFLDAVRTRSAPPITLEEARAALAVALEIQEQIANHTRRAGII
ncbi:MAG: Gfo/Idh/MocA family oxidoreductase [Acidobacteria bacterium]|nr:Gfo/Idh/MocA family oxidoreductase [Acidobacteriota bacterium]